MSAFLVAALGLIAANPPGLYDPSALVFRLTVSPAPVPAPRLRYELLPRLRDRTPGNAAIDYLRAAVLLPKEPKLEHDEWSLRYERHNLWRQAPAAGLPLAAVKRELQPYEKAMAAADRAARAARCDWQPPGPLTFGTDTYNTDSAPLREVMSWLQFRFKVELTEGRTEDALRTMQTAFQMAKHIGEGPTLIQSLVGVAIAAIAADMAAQWTTRADGANLYWALATLPEPLIDPRATVAGEAEILANTFAFTEFEKGPVSEAEAKRLVAKSQELTTEMMGWDRMFDRLAGSDAPAARVPDWLPWELYIIWKAPASRRWLRGQGVSDTARMAGTQAVYLAAWLKARPVYDAGAAALVLPLPQGLAEARRVEEMKRRLRANNPDDRILRGLLVTVAATEKVFSAHCRLRRQVAALQAVEAIRAHLVTGKGFPAGWAEVTAVPLPDDPLTGKPFGYTLKDGVATIAAPPPAGEQPNRSNNFRYELKLRPVK